MKNKNNIKFLGFLGFLGLLGIYTGNAGFYGFFGFFFFFPVAAKSDERLAENTYRSGFNAFIVALLGLSTMITGLSMESSINTIALIIAGTFIIMLFTFVISFMVFERI